MKGRAPSAYWCADSGGLADRLVEPDLSPGVQILSSERFGWFKQHQIGAVLVVPKVAPVGVNARDFQTVSINLWVQDELGPAMMLSHSAGPPRPHSQSARKRHCVTCPTRAYLIDLIWAVTNGPPIRDPVRKGLHGATLSPG